MNTTMTQPKRGQALYNLIGATNDQYKAKNIAMIIAASGSHPHYFGAYNGYPVYFEATSTNQRSRFDLNNFDRAQIMKMQQAYFHGAKCFVLIEFSVFREVMFVPFATIQMYLNHAKTGGPSSVPRDDFEYYGYLVQKTKRAPLDYLLLVDKMIGCK